ncbi:UNKNOWN [Stylonychia lemnae]|uniref:Uncharacterized protein n=1 Tax=Stylonychia lemnae TaxID=5949 RepID=A0A078AJN5_STYLE|nr:UNKNOWN [Stylonychia lemnae]|eukprot:CDW82590.1 UNKNOWN [Stylonychia lemnae]
MFYILIGYFIALVFFLIDETLTSSLIILFQILVICSAIYTYYYGVFAFITACSLTNMYYFVANMNKYNITMTSLFIIFFIYASYYSYILYDQLKEQYNEQHSIAYKAYYQYIQRKVLHGNEYINADLERMKLLGLFNPREEIERKQKEEAEERERLRLANMTEEEKQAIIDKENERVLEIERRNAPAPRPIRENLIEYSSDE